MFIQTARRPIYLDGDAGGGGGEGDKGDEGKTKEPVLTQEDLNRVGTQQKAEGKRAAERAIADKLGVSVDEAADIIKAHQEAAAKDDSEAEKARKAADKAKTEADAAKADAAAERHAARVERALVAAGVTDEKKIERLARLIDTEEGAELDVIKADVASLKKESPEFFGETKEADDDGDGEPEIDPATGKPKVKPGEAGGDPARPKVKTTKSEDAFNKGAERAKKTAPTTYPILGGDEAGAAT